MDRSYSTQNEEPWSDISGWSSVSPEDVRSNRYSEDNDRDISERMSRSLEIERISWTASAIPPYTERSQTLEHHGTVNVIQKTSRNSKPVENLDQTEKLKNKFLSAWNNMRHGWTVKTKTSFRFGTPIWLLGKDYRCTREELEEQREKEATGRRMVTTFEKFKRDFTSRIWFTYRKDFPALYGSVLTTDVGWGCMLRTGQMLLAQALVMHYLNRDWRWYPSQKKHEVISHMQIVRYFGDFPFRESPFSIQRLVRIGVDSGKRPGDWYGPASVAYVLREAMEQAAEYNPLLGQICLYVAQDCTVYKQDVIDLCTRVSSRSRRESARTSSTTSEYSQQGEVRTPDDHWRAVIILIPVRLGGEDLNTVYVECVQCILAHDMCVGIIGGKPKHSLYFIGWQDDKLIYLDPHFCQEVVDVRRRDFPLRSYHCMSPRKMPVTKMDPSCTLGFYCNTRADFDRFIRDAQEMTTLPKEKGAYPMFVFAEGRSTDIRDSVEQPDLHHPSRATRKPERGREDSTTSDDYVFL